MTTIAGRWDRKSQEPIHDCPMTGRTESPLNCLDCEYLGSAVSNDGLFGISHFVECSFDDDEQDWADYCEAQAERRAVMAGAG